MTQSQVPNQYSGNPTAPGTTPNVHRPSPVRSQARRRRRSESAPDARLAQAFLTQAFVWMFAGLLVHGRRGGRRPVQRRSS